MRIIERRAEALNLDIRRPSPVQAREIFDKCREVVEVSAETNSNRKRRREQIVWLTVVSILRKKEHHST
jgi:hypothetical protein